MSQINPQFTYDDLGNPIGVFLPIKEWNSLVRDGVIDIPGWQKKLIDSKLEEYKNNPENTNDWEDILAEMKAEDEKV